MEYFTNYLIALTELKKQAYEQRRKEYEQLRKLKRKQQNAENKKRKRKEKEAEAAMMVDPSQPAPPPKKRPRKKKPDSLEEDLDAKAGHFIQMLGTLPAVPLEEPRVGNFFSVLNVPGSPNVITGKTVQLIFVIISSFMKNMLVLMLNTIHFPVFSFWS